MTVFEYDENKSQSNFVKHGIDFIEAQKLWNDPNLLEIPARTQDELRFLVIAKIDNKHWSRVITYRDQNIRIISVHRSRTEEIALYDS
ncbi:BrnT family toxin [Halotia branconii]|uniref:BrnT family toxin n=1 Tax=Halotia branconii CENA392 TaxID=1539056 RepID=A0AAJ6PBA3_9CYAN|nr:BrnT family toxin [Halotia branconii]WGV27556.1 BrnT family toxin [Halotia branconii CENA392]